MHEGNLNTHVLIPTKDEEPSAIRRTVESLISQETPPTRIIICDASESPETINCFDELAENDVVEVIHQDGAGVGDARQALYKAVPQDTDYVITADVGLDFRSDYISTIVELHEENPNVDIVTGTGDPDLEGDLSSSYNEGVYFKQNHAAIRKESLDKVEGWDRNFIRQEDFDIKLRMSEAGLTSLSSPDLEPESYFQESSISNAKIMACPNSPGFLRKYGVQFAKMEPMLVIRDGICASFLLSLLLTPFLFITVFYLVIPIVLFAVLIAGEAVKLPYSLSKSAKLALSRKSIQQNTFRGASVCQSIYDFWIGGEGHNWNLGGVEDSTRSN